MSVTAYLPTPEWNGMNSKLEYLPSQSSCTHKSTTDCLARRECGHGPTRTHLIAELLVTVNRHFVVWCNHRLPLLKPMAQFAPSITGDTRRHSLSWQNVQCLKYDPYLISR